MKQFLFLTIAIVLLGCADDDSNTVLNQDAFLIGQWKATSFTRENDNVTFDLSNCDDEAAIDYHATWRFIEVNSGVELQNDCEQDLATYREFKYNNNTLSFIIPIEFTGGNGGDTDFVVNVEKLSDIKMKITWASKGVYIFDKQQ